MPKNKLGYLLNEIKILLVQHYYVFLSILNVLLNIINPKMNGLKKRFYQLTLIRQL